MKEIISNLSDEITNAIPEDYRHVLLVFPEGDGKVDIVTDIGDMDELVNRLAALILHIENKFANKN